MADARPRAPVPSRPWPPRSSPAAQGSSARTCASYLLAAGYKVICIDNLETASLKNIEHIRGDDFVFMNHDVMEPIEVEEPVDVVYPPRRDPEPDRLPPAAAADAEDRLIRDAQRARAREVEARPLRARLDERGLRRSASPPAARDLLGKREPGRAARRLRRGQALLGGDDDGVPPPAGRRHGASSGFSTPMARRMRANDGRAIPTFVRQALEDKPLTVFGDGSQTRSFCYVDDLVRGMYLLAMSEEHSAHESREPERVYDPRACGNRNPGNGLARARSSTRPCRWTIRRPGSPTSHGQRRFSAGNLKSNLKRGSGECCRASEGSQ